MPLWRNWKSVYLSQSKQHYLFKSLWMKFWTKHVKNLLLQNSCEKKKLLALVRLHRFFPDFQPKLTMLWIHGMAEYERTWLFRFFRFSTFLWDFMGLCRALSSIVCALPTTTEFQPTADEHFSEFRQVVDLGPFGAENVFHNFE